MTIVLHFYTDQYYICIIKLIFCIDDAVFNVQSCDKRCFEEISVTSQLVVDHVRQCNCFLGCEVNQTCCPDFLSVCFTDTKKETKIPEINSVTKQMTERYL